MKLTSVLVGVALLSFYIFIVVYYKFLLFYIIDLIPVLALGGFLLVSGARSKSVKNIKRKSDQSMFDGIMNIGLEKRDNTGNCKDQRRDA